MLPWLTGILFSAGIRVDRASDWRLIITGPFGGCQHIPGRTHHQTLINTTQELGKTAAVPGERSREVTKRARTDWKWRVSGYEYSYL